MTVQSDRCIVDILSLPKANDADLIQEYLQYKNELIEEQNQCIKICSEKREERKSPVIRRIG